MMYKDRHIETERLIVKPFTILDADFIVTLVNTPKWKRFIGDKGIHSMEDAQRYLKMGPIKSYQEHNFGLSKVLLKEAQISIGMCGILKRENLGYPDLGFAILPEFEGKGYITEAARGVLKDAKERFAFKTIFAMTTLDNYGSQRVLLKCGFSHHGTLKNEKMLLSQYKIHLD